MWHERPSRSSPSDNAEIMSGDMSASGAASTGLAIRWVFLDRDGTLNVKPSEGEYVTHPDELRLLPGAAEGVARLNRAGLWTGLVTNQRGIALERMSLGDLDAVHARLAELLRVEGASLDAIYVCPHGLGECSCRKPAPGLLLQARAEHPEIDFSRAAIVGDSASDVQAGQALGLRTVLITGCSPTASEGANDNKSAKSLVSGRKRNHSCEADELALDLIHAVDFLIAAS